MNRTRIRVAVRNIAEAAVADGLTTQVADAAVPAPVAPIILPTCRAGMPRAPRLRARTRRAATRNPVPVRTVAEVMVVAIARAATEVAAAVADTRAAVLPAHTICIPG